MNPTIEQLGQKVLAGGSLTRDDAAALVAHQDLHDVLYWAHCVREARFGDDVKFCSIGAGKVGACSEDCKWCAQSSRYATHIPAEVERTSAEGLHKACVEAFAAGASSFGVVNSGRAPSEADLVTVTEVAATIAAEGGGDGVRLAGGTGRRDRREIGGCGSSPVQS